MSSPFRRLFWSPLGLAEWSPASSTAYAVGAMDWLETPNAHVLKFNVPGFGREDVKVQLEEENVLVIEGNAAEEEEKDVIWYVAERGKGGFSRRIQLPENVRADQIKANVDKGLLTIFVPKEMPKAKPKPRAIHVNSKL